MTTYVYIVEVHIDETSAIELVTRDAQAAWTHRNLDMDWSFNNDTGKYFTYNDYAMYTLSRWEV